MIAALIAAVVVCVISFMLLFFPVVAGYCHAVRQSRREEYFIDLNNVFRTTFLVFQGIRRFFLQSYVLGLTGLLPAVFLYICPLAPWMVWGEEAMMTGAFLLVLWIPAFFLTGAVLFYGFPYLIESNSGTGSLLFALTAGKTKPLGTFGRGFLLLSPFPGALIHFLMVFSYPILVAWAVSTTGDPKEIKMEMAATGRVTPGKLLIGLGLAAVMFGVIYGVAWIFGGLGFFIGIGISFILAFLFRKILVAK